MYDELVKRCKALTDYNGYVSDEMIQEAFDCVKGAADAIEELIRKIERLESMREITPEAEYAIDKHADNIISHMEELIRGLENKPRWIPVTERLPSVGEKVLVVTIGKGKQYAETDTLLATGEWFDYGNVTHWMPLPEPPKEEA